MRKTDNFYEYKSLVLGDAVQYNMYHTLITTCPSILWSIFLGAWIDNYKNGRKVIFLIGSMTAAVESFMNSINAYFFDLNVNYILVSFIPYAFSGSMNSMTVYSYAAKTTPTKWRTIRIMIIELVINISSPLAKAVSGNLLLHRPIGGNGQLHNYAFIFVLSTTGFLVAFLWVIFFIDEHKDKKKFDTQFGEIIENDLELKNDVIPETEIKDKNPMKLLFNLQNVKDIVQTCVKKRDNSVRLQIWLIFATMLSHHFVAYAPNVYEFQFVEKIYFWDAEYYGYISSIGTITHALFTLTCAPLLIKTLKLNDMLISIIGNCGYFTQVMIRGVILTPMGYYISLLTGITASMASVGLKAYLSKIVDPLELGKIFTLMAVIDATAPIVASSLFAYIFKSTVESFPSLCFLILSGLTFIPILTAMWIDIYFFKPKTDENKSCDSLETKF